MKVPRGWKLEDGYTEKSLRKTQPVTVGDLRDFMADLPDDAPVWVSRYDEASDELYSRPVESMGASTGSGYNYLSL